MVLGVASGRAVLCMWESRIGENEIWASAVHGVASDQ